MLKLSLLFLLLITYISHAYSLKLERHEKLQIHADSSLLNYKNGINIYEGNVILNQGTMHLSADRLITKSNQSHQMQETIAYGLTSLAHYWTAPSQKDKELHARAKIIKFYPIEANVILQQEAILKQGENSFEGELIIYNRQSETINVPALNQSRAVLIYHPEK